MTSIDSTDDEVLEADIDNVADRFPEESSDDELRTALFEEWCVQRGCTPNSLVAAVRERIVHLAIAREKVKT